MARPAVPHAGSPHRDDAVLLAKWLTLAHRPQHAPPALAHEGGQN